MATPISIAGAGPSGLTAAIALARAGYAVDVYERNRDAGERFRGDLQGLENWTGKGDVLDDLRAWNIEVNFAYHPQTSLHVSNGEEVLRLSSFSRPYVYLVKRGSVAGSLDQGLKAQALAAGVRMHYDTVLPPERANIVATGPLLHNLVAVAKGVVFATQHSDVAFGLVHDDAAYKGYAYLLIANGYGCMCTVLFDQFPTINRAWETTRESFSRLVPVDMRDEKSVGGVGGFLLKPQWTRPGQLFVGEAAGLQDLLWGFGIRSAMQSGWLAARSIIEHRSYERLAEKAYGRYVKAGVVNRYVWERFGNHRYVPMLQRLQTTSDPIRLLRSFYRYNLLQRFLYPFARTRLQKRYVWL